MGKKTISILTGTIFFIFSVTVSYYLGGKNKIKIEQKGNPILIQKIKLRNDFELYIGYDEYTHSRIDEISLWKGDKQLMFEIINKDFIQLKILRNIPSGQIYTTYDDLGNKIKEKKIKENIIISTHFDSNGKIIKTFKSKLDDDSGQL
jgi:hypothetical protein